MSINAQIIAIRRASIILEDADEFDMINDGYETITINMAGAHLFIRRDHMVVVDSSNNINTTINENLMNCWRDDFGVALDRLAEIRSQIAA